jgi:hypothetical protein
LDKATNAVRQALVARTLAAAQRVQGRAYLRSITNVGIGAGSAVAGIAIAIDTRPAYLTLVLVDAMTFLLTAGVLRGLPQTGADDRRTGGGMLVALRDRPFVVITLLNAVLSTHFAILEIGLPLWVDRHTSAPTWCVAGLFLINTGSVVLFQVRASRAAVDVKSSAIAMRRGALLLAASYLVFALSQGRSPVPAVLILVVASFVNVAGELQQSAGSWGLGFGLPPEHAQNQYQGLYSTGFAAASMLGPILVTSTAIAHGAIGWLVLAAGFAVAGLAGVPAAHWAYRSHELEHAGTAGS